MSLLIGLYSLQVLWEYMTPQFSKSLKLKIDKNQTIKNILIAVVSEAMQFPELCEI